MLKTLLPLDTGDSITIEDYGEVWKLNGPTENCEEISTATKTCANQVCGNGFLLNNFIHNI